MDTKLKNSNRNRIIGILICFLLLSAISISVIASYKLIQTNYDILMQKKTCEEEDSIENDEKSEFIEELFKGNYSLYWDIKQKSKNDIITPSDIFITPPDDNSDEEYKQEFTYFSSDLNNLLNEWHDRFLTLVVNDYQLEYYVVDNKSGLTLSNTNDNLKLLMEDTEEAQEIKEKYPFYEVFKYNYNDAIEIPILNGLEDSYKSKSLSLELDKTLFYDELGGSYWSYDQIKSPSSVTIIYASTAENVYNRGEDDYTGYWKEWCFRNGGFLYVYRMAMICVILLALMLPLKKSWRLGEGLAVKIPFEISLISIMAMICLYQPLQSMAMDTLSETFCSTLHTIASLWLYKVLIHGVNFIVWMIVLTICFIAILSFRQIGTIGLKRYIKEKTLTVKFIHWLTGRKKWFVRKMKELYNYLASFDLTDSSNKAILKILAVNFVILMILCCIWVFGIFGLIIYTIILFIILRKYFEDLKKKYAILLDSTSKIAKGNLEVSIEEDLGVFEPIKMELTKVQFGFKKAVEEEMKSQKMKTELITNVSHDLKTPLTAIITYVNLLKEDNITEEERSSYIETLDNKSQRLKKLIEDLFEVSKASSNNITLNLVGVDISALIKQVLLELDYRIEQSEVKFHTNFPVEKVVLKLDSEKTYRIFENLIVNITKYAMPHTRAYIDVNMTDDCVRVILKNVSAEELNFNSEEISERFARGDKARNTEGSGLGLAIVKSFVEIQGGKFEILLDGDLFKAVITWKKK